MEPINRRDPAPNVFRVSLIGAAIILGVLLYHKKSDAQVWEPSKGLIKIAVLDTGYTPQNDQGVPTCAEDNKDFTGEGTIQDFGYLLHGTNVAGIIGRIASEGGASGKYCIMVLKIFDRNRKLAASYPEALLYALSRGASIVNLSLSGGSESFEETKALRKLLDKNVVVVAAAGNQKLNLNKGCRSFPACVDKRIIVISARDVESANYGKVVDAYLPGKNIYGGGIVMSGTSQAAASFSGQTVVKAVEIQERIDDEF